VRAHVDDDDTRPTAGQSERRAAADPATGAGDYRDAAFQRSIWMDVPDGRVCNPVMHVWRLLVAVLEVLRVHSRRTKDRPSWYASA
jgi:hypothetical protein